MSNHGTPESKAFELVVSPKAFQLGEVKKDVEALKARDPFRVAEMALEIQIERMHIIEAMNARDAVVQRLAEAYVSINQKNATIEDLLREKDSGEEKLKLVEHITHLEGVIRSLQEAQLRPEIRSLSPLNSATPTIETIEPSKVDVDDANELDTKILRNTKEPEDMAKARHAILVSLPLPVEIPDDSLKPILIPSPFTLHEFLSNASGSLRNSLSNYRIFQQLTTSWCPEREEHGYMLAPVFKCSTNPRVATAHRWTAVDVIAGMNKPTECFYNRDGKWYYAGIYKAFQLDDLTTKEWEALSSETAQIIIKDTIAGRKNTSPQNVYETAQLYAAGALRVACIGLQCVGFNNSMYRAILELAGKCAQNGKWRVGGTVVAAAGSGLGAGGAWNASAGTESTGERTRGVISMTNRNLDGIENMPGDRLTKLIR